MSDFDPKWLALREPVDHAARADQLIEPLTLALKERCQSADVWQVVDLGAGTASNFRYLAPRLPCDQIWHCYESDSALIELGLGELQRWAERGGFESRINDQRIIIESEQRSLGVYWHHVNLQSTSPTTLLEGCDLVTCAALLDLVSSAWLEGIIAAMGQCTTIGLFALTYDGRVDWEPGIDGDRDIVDLLNQDQRTDKGFGRALGPDASTALCALCTRHGLNVTTGGSDWHLDSEARQLHEHMLSDLRTLAIATRRDRASADNWHRQRRSLIESAARMTVGHRDQLVVPATRTARHANR